MREFAEAVKTELEKKIDAEVLITETLKNNGLTRTAMTIRRSGHQTAPTFYVEQMEGSSEIVAQNILTALERLTGEDEIVERLEELMEDQDELKNSIYPRLVNLEWNEVLLKTLPHRRFLVFAATYVLELGDGLSCRITAEMMRRLSVWNEERLYKAAISNLRAKGYQILPIHEMISHMMEREGTVVGFMPESLPMLVITTPDCTFGAAVLLDEELLKEVGRMCGDYYILPSSVNEVIVVPEAAVEDSKYLKELVMAVNQSSVPREEWLSESVYKFDGGERGVLRIAD